MDFELLGWPDDGPTLDLDHEAFAYAGKFVMTSTGKAVVHDGDQIVGAVAFSPDYDDPTCMRLRYVTVRASRRGEGIGPRLLRFTAGALLSRHETVTLAVNNPIAYEAATRAGFVWTGEETGIAELLLRYDPKAVSADTYQAGWDVFRDRVLPDEHRAVLDRHSETAPPPPVAVPE